MVAGAGAHLRIEHGRIIHRQRRLFGHPSLLAKAIGGLQFVGPKRDGHGRVEDVEARVAGLDLISALEPWQPGQDSVELRRGAFVDVSVVPTLHHPAGRGWGLVDPVHEHAVRVTAGHHHIGNELRPVREPHALDAPTANDQVIDPTVTSNTTTSGFETSSNRVAQRPATTAGPALLHQVIGREVEGGHPGARHVGPKTPGGRCVGDRRHRDSPVVEVVGHDVIGGALVPVQEAGCSPATPSDGGGEPAQ